MARKRYRRRRRNPQTISRRSKTSYLVVGMGIAGGIAAVLLWPRIRALFTHPSITVGQPVLSPGAMEALMSGKDTPAGMINGY
jgi:predicted phosphoribosyltransferase